MTDDRCQTKYPILLIHGTAFRDWRGTGLYWGRIPKVLEDHGARLFYGGQDGWAMVEENGAALARRVEEILTQTGAEKIHLIAHSKGGLEARYLASSLGLGERLASVTLIATPNRGSVTMDRLYRLPRWLYRLCGFFTNTWFRLLGDRRPDFCAVCEQFTTGWTEAFNAANPDVPGLVYRSYAGVMSTWRSDFFLPAPAPRGGPQRRPGHRDLRPLDGLPGPLAGGGGPGGVPHGRGGLPPPAPPPPGPGLGRGGRVCGHGGRAKRVGAVRRAEVPGCEGAWTKARASARAA